MDYHGTSGDDVLDQTKLGVEDWSNIFGGAGNDTITIGNGKAIGEAGNDTIIGMYPYSGVAYWGSPKGVVVNLATGIAEDGFGTIDIIKNIGVVHGTSFSDKFTGNAGNNEFWGNGGNDTFIGGGGTDTVVYLDAKRGEAQIAYDAKTDTFTVAKRFANGDQGTDILTGITYLTFRGAQNYEFSVTKYDVGSFPKTNSFQVSLAAGAALASAKSGDFNGDGNLDVVLGQSVGSGTALVPVLVFLGDGKGNFVDGSASIFSAGAAMELGAVRMLVADFNNDGVSDIFRFNFGVDDKPWTGGKNTLYLSSAVTHKLADASGSLQQTLQLNHAGAVGDVNGDGYVDVLVNSITDGNFLQMNDGTGHFVDRSDLIPHPRWSVNPSFALTDSFSGIMDVNGDGHPDIVLGKRDSSLSIPTSQVLLNDGSGNFTKTAPISLPPSGVFREETLDVKSIDLNGDNLPDLMLNITSGGDDAKLTGQVSPTNYLTPYIQLLINDGNGKFHDETALRLPQSLSGNTGSLDLLTSVDFNHDGYPDILASASPNVSSTVYLNRGDGTFYEYWKSAINAETIGLDVNNDGMTDLVTITYVGGSPTFSVSLNNLPNGHIYKANFGGDNLLGSSGKDAFYNGQGNDVINGNGGVDTLISPASRATYAISKTSTGFALKDLAGLYGTDALTNIQRLQFSDKSVALDLDGNAGKAAKILGAVFGAGSVANEQFVGIGLSLLDGGISYQDLMQLALNAKLGSGFTNAAEVTLLYQNLIGTAPGQGDLAYWDGVLASHQYTQASLAAMAADTAINTGNIHLTGLPTTGLDYQPAT